MSKKGFPMDIWFQLYNLPRMLICKGYDELLDSIDVDPKLHLPENYQRIKSLNTVCGFNCYIEEKQYF